MALGSLSTLELNVETKPPRLRQINMSRACGFVLSNAATTKASAYIACELVKDYNCRGNPQRRLSALSRLYANIFSQSTAVC